MEPTRTSAVGWNPAIINGWNFLGPGTKPNNPIIGLGNQINPDYNYLTNTFSQHRDGTNCESPSTTWGFWPLLVILIVIFILWAEYRSQYCTGKACHQLARVSASTDTTEELFDNLINQVESTHTIVFWRVSMLSAIVVALFILLFFYPVFPSGSAFFICATWIFIGIYGGFSWTVAHWYRQNANKTEYGIRQLQTKIRSDL